MDIFDNITEIPNTPETSSGRESDVFDKLSPSSDTGVFSKAVGLAATGADIINQTLAGTAETGASLATGMVSTPVSGLAMIAGLITKGNFDKAIEYGETVSDYMTYKPSSRYGKIYTEAAGKLLGLPAKGIRAGGEFLVEQGMDPAAATILTTLIELAVYALLFKGAKGVFPKGYDPAKISPADMLKAEKALDDFYGKIGSPLLKDKPILGEESKAPMGVKVGPELQPAETPPIIKTKAEMLKEQLELEKESALNAAFKKEQGKAGEPLIQREPILGEASKPPKPMSVKERLQSQKGSIDLGKVKDLLPFIKSLQPAGQDRALVSISELRAKVVGETGAKGAGKSFLKETYPTFKDYAVRMKEMGIPLETLAVEKAKGMVGRLTREELEAQGYIPIYRGTGEKGFAEVKPTEGGVYGEGVYFYTEPSPARSHATTRGGVITGFVKPEDATIKGSVAVVKDLSKVILRGKIPVEETTITGEKWIARTEQALSEGEIKGPSRFVNVPATEEEYLARIVREEGEIADNPLYTQYLAKMKEEGRKPTLTKDDFAKIGSEAPTQGKMTNAEFDAALLQLSKDGKVALHQHDFPGSLTEAERGKLLSVEDKTAANRAGGGEPGRAYYGGVVPIKEATVKTQTPNVKPDKLLSEEGFIDVETFKKAGKSIKEFFIPFSSIPNKDQILLERYRTIGQIDRSEQYIKGIFNKLDKFPDDVKGDIFKYLDGQIPLNNLPVEAQAISKSLQTDTKAIGGLLVQKNIISQEAFDNLKGRYIHYLYAKNILGEDSPIGVSPTGKLNLSYAKHRKDLTVDERKALGLIEDAQIAVPVGMGRALTDIAKYDYMDFLSKNPDVTWQPSIVDVPLRSGQKPVKMGIGQLTEEVKTYEKMVKELSSPEVDARYNILKTSLDQAMQQTKNMPPDFVQLPVSKTYGPLSGAFVKKPIADDLMPIMNSIKNRGRLFETLVNVEQQGMAYFKMTKVPLNIPTVVRNIVSNIIQNNMRGRNLTEIPGDVVKASKSMLAKDGFFKEAQKYGIFKTSWAATEIKEILNQFSKAKGGTYAGILDAVKNVAKYYGRIDDISKFTIFRQLRADGFPIEVATLEAQKWGMDYSLASRSVKHLRQHIVPFLSYQYKIAPLIAESLAKRPWVIGKYMAIPLIAKAMTMEMNDMTDSDWDKLQKQLPFYIKNSNSYMILPGKSPSGNYQWMNYSYFLPWGNYLQVYEGLSNKDIGQVINSIGISNPFLDMITMFKSAKGDDPPKHSFTGQPLYNRLDPPHVKAAKVVEALASTFIPPMLTRQAAAGYTYSAAVGGKDKWGREITPGQAVGRWFGANIIETTPKQTAVIKKSMEKEIRSDLYKIAVDPTKSLKEKHDAQEKARQQIKEIYQ